MNEFEKACEQAEADRNFESDSENAIEWIRNSDKATVFFSQGRYITKIEKLAKKFPDEVEIKHRNYNREGNVSSIVAHIPVSYIKINNSKREISEVERELLRERARNNLHVDKNADETP